MRISKRALLAICAALTAAVVTGSAAGALGADGTKHHDKSSHGTKHHGNSSLGGEHQGAPLIKESLAPSMPTDPPFHNVMAGGKPWALKFGDVRLKSDGHLDLRVKGLVIPPPQGNGTPGAVTSISAALFCGADTNMAVAGTTLPVPLSPKGDARIHDTSFTVPPTCLAPVILVEPHGPMVPAGIYIAVDGWRS
jgi:hypothetical protein